MLFESDPPSRADFSTPWADIPAMLFPAYGETWAMVGQAMILLLLIGLPLGVVVFNSSPAGLFPNKTVFRILSFIINVGRSLPFVILVAAIIPFTRLLVGTTIGIGAAVVPMTVGGIPFFARLIENALRDVRRETIEMGISSGGSTVQLIRRVQLSEALPSIVGAITITVIVMIEFSAIAGSLGAGGIGYLAVSYGYNRFDDNVMLATIIVLILTIQAVQFIGDRLIALVKK